MAYTYKYPRHAVTADCIVIRGRQSPASEDDMDDNGMQRYFDANDEDAWD